MTFGKLDRTRDSCRQTPNNGSVSEVSSYVGRDCEVWMGHTFSGQSGDQFVNASQSEQREILTVRGSMGFLSRGAERLGRATGQVYWIKREALRLYVLRLRPRTR